MTPRPLAIGKRRFRECTAKGCGKPYYGPAPYCGACRQVIADRFQAIGVVVVCVLIVLVP